MQSKFWNCRFFLFLFMILIATLSYNSCQKRTDENILATVGPIKITVDEFIENYELSPRPGIVSRTRFTPRLHLDKMIENKLLALYGAQHDYEYDPRIANQIRAVSKNILVQQLYRTQVAQKTDVTEAELRDGFLKSKTSIRARHLFVKTKQDADSLLKLVNQGVSFHQLSEGIFRDSTLAQNGGDLGYFSFGDMDEDFERAAYGLKVGEVSRPVKTKWGYHIIKVEDRIESPIVTENEFQTNRHKIEPVILKRKQERLAQQYVKEFMAPKNVVAKADAINFLVGAARRLEKATKTKLPSDLPLANDEEINSVQNEIDDHLNDVIVEFEGGAWTIQEFFEKMMETLPQDRPDLTSHLSIAEKIAVMARNEFLSEEAKRLGLENQPWAKAMLAQEKDKLVANLVRMDIVESIQISDEEVANHYSDFPDKFSSPEKYKLKEIVVADATAGAKIHQQLLDGADFSELARQYSIREQSALRGGETGYISRVDNPEIVKHVSNLNIGQITEPFPVSGHFVILQLVDKQSPQVIPFDQIREQVKQDLWNSKVRLATDSVLKPQKEKNKIWINENLLQSLESEDRKNVEMVGFER